MVASVSTTRAKTLLLLDEGGNAAIDGEGMELVSSVTLLLLDEGGNAAVSPLRGRKSGSDAYRSLPGRSSVRAGA